MAETLRWDLTELYPDPDSPETKADFQKVQRLARSFDKKYRGNINSPNLTADFLASALRRLEKIQTALYKLEMYAELNFSLNTRDEGASAFAAQMKRLEVSIKSQIIFFDLEWKALPKVQAEQLTGAPKLARWQYALESERLTIPHTLSEPEEVILERKSIITKAWQTHYTKIVGRIEVNGKALDYALGKGLYNPDRETRRTYQRTITAALEGEMPYMVDVFNALLADFGDDANLRNYEEPIDIRNLSNSVSRTAVEALLEVCDANAEIVARYYHLKRRILGLKQLYDYDRYAPLPFGTGKMSLRGAQDLIVSAYQDFSPRLGEIARRAFTEGWIDSPLSPGKIGGAFCFFSPVGHPWVLLNWVGSRRDVIIAAHELGHAAHNVLYKDVSILQANPGMPMAETASVFGERLVFDARMRQITDPREKLALLCETLENSFATIFRQAAFTRFEQRLHENRAENELSVDQIRQYWMDTQNAMFQGSVKLTKNYSWWWVYIHHFVQYPFYCYAYAFGNLLVLALYAQYKKEGESFVPKYLDLLSAGGSDTPANLLAKFEIDIENPDFWQEGMEILREMVEEAEQLASEI